MSQVVSSSEAGPLSDEWGVRVEKEVTKINQDDKIKVQTQISAAWKNNAAKIKKNRLPEGKVQLAEIPAIVLNDSEINVSKKRKFAKVTAPLDKNKKTQVSEIIEIEDVPTHPNMITWAPIRRNVLTEDDHYHSNIPYFGDTEIGSNFIKSFEENVNNKVNIFDADNEDHMFMDLVKSLAKIKIKIPNESELLEDPKTEEEKKWHLISSVDTSIPGLVVFQAIAKNYPDYANVEDLIKKFKKLSDVQATTNLVQDLDGPNAQAISAEAAIHSYKSLLCRRCFKYDCPLHNDPFVDEPVKVDKEEAPLPSSPCGPDCFLNLPSVRGLMSPLSSMNNNKSQSKFSYDPALAKRVAKKLLGEHYTKENLNRWVNSEITLFRMLAKSFQSNWCAIAQGVMTKTCKQVYEFSKQELGNAVDIKKRSSSLSRRPGNKTGKKKNTKAKQAALYKGHSKDGERESTMPYTPCHHPGLPCSDDICSCRQAGNFCEKFCYCPQDCRMRFPGCKCKSKCTTNACACFKACRECDPDLCSSCLDTVDTGNIEFNPDTNSCRNVMVQRELGKKLYVAPSDIAGWGCFLGERANKNEFIAEYLGEMISQEESERRGKIYDKAKCSYMFNLNEEFCVDAARMGGKIRFANHSSKPNCKVKILMVNGDHRIGIYANKPMEEGEELFFDYGPQANKLCPDLAEEDLEGREVRLREIDKAKKRAKRLRKRNTDRYALRQFRDENSASVRPCEVSLEYLEVPPEMIEIVKRTLEKREERAMSSEFVVGCDSEDDSVDGLLKSSSDSDSDGRDSIEILSEEEGDGRPRPPLREWRIKKEIIEIVDTGELMESCSPPSLQMDQSHKYSEQPDTESGPSPPLKSNVLEERREFASEEHEQEEEIINLSSDEEKAPEEEELPIIQLQQVPSDPPEAASPNLSPASELAFSTPVSVSLSQDEQDARTQMSMLLSQSRSGNAILEQTGRTLDDTNDSIDYGPPSRRSKAQEVVVSDSCGSEADTLEMCPNRTVMVSQDNNDRAWLVPSASTQAGSLNIPSQEIVLTDSDGSEIETLETFPSCPNRTVILSEDNRRDGNFCAEDKDKSDSDNSYVALVKDEREDFKKEDDDIEELLRNSPTDVFKLSDSENNRSTAPPPPPTDLEMRAALMRRGDRRRSQSRVQERRSRSRSGETPLFVIGDPRTVREESESDEDVRIVPGRRKISDKNYIQID